MASRTPSYIYQSPHGVWYFQVWIPERFRHTSGQKKLIRKSLRTRCRKQALRLAKKLWVQVEENRYDWADRAEREHAEDERLYFTGKSIAARVKEDGVDLDNPFERDNYFETLTDWEIKAFAFYENHQLEQQQTTEPQPVVPTLAIPPTPTTGIQLSTLRVSDIVDTWIRFNTEVRSEETRWAPSSVKKFRSTVMMMVNMVGNPFAHELTKVQLRDLYAERLPLMPKGIGNKKIYHDDMKLIVDDDGKPVLDAKGKPKTKPVWKLIDEILEIAKKTSDDKYDGKTIAGSVENVITFLKWAEKQEHVQTRLYHVLEDLAKSANTKKQTGTYFTDGELKLLF